MRVHNFCAGPCTLPVSVLEEVAAEFVDYRGSGMALIEMSHRSAEYDAVHESALDLFRRVFGVPDEFEILFLQGGATLMFAAVAMNILHQGQLGAYVRSGTWGLAAERDAAFTSEVYPAWDGRAVGYLQMPSDSELEIRPGTRYLHITSNETIEGIRYATFPDVDVALVADMSSDYVSRPIPWDRFDLVYGGAQKNLGPAGVAVVVVRKSVLEKSNRNLASYLRFDLQAEKRSLLNTPPMFSIYVMGKVLSWIEDQGGVGKMAERAAGRSGRVYQAVADSAGFYTSPVVPEHRSHMNVVFRLPSPDLEERFLKESDAAGLVNLKGHRSVGGIRASIYNAMPDQGVDALVEFMGAFAAAQA